MIPLRSTCLLVVTAVFLMSITICLTIYLVTRDPTLPLIIVDTDGGVDDLIALTMLYRSGAVHIEAITTVAGITGVANATRNVLTLLSMLNVNSVSVHAGEENEVSTEGYYGWDGLGDFLPVAPELEMNRTKAATKLAQIINQHSGTITLLCLGPLSNLAGAISIQPDLLKKISQIIIVGATFNGGGNVGENMEFNVASDPEAASQIFNATSIQRPILLIPVEVIDKDASFPTEWRKAKLGSIESNLIYFFNKAENKSLDKSDVWACYDQSAAAVVISPGMIKSKMTGVIQVNTSGATNFSPGLSNNVDVVTGLNIHRLQRLLFETFL